MKKNSVHLFYLSFAILIVLFGCSPQVLEETPLQDEITKPIAESTASDAPANIEEINLDDLLDVGSKMEWFDKGFLIFIPEGEVNLGNSDYEDNPEHNVYLDDYWIYTFKVTNGQYYQCVQTGTCLPLTSKPPYPDIADPEIKDHPVVGTTWEQAQTYCEWMNASLPTEAQWEKAARGPDSNTYPWGENEATCKWLNFGDCGYGSTTKVFEFPDGISFYGAYDMAGNTFEWTKDWYQADYAANAPDANPPGPESGSERAIRGSSFKSNIDELASAQRAYLNPEQYRPDLGFRCVVTDLEAFAPYCIQAAFVPGDPLPWQEGPPPGETPPDPEFGEGECIDWGAGFEDTLYCAYQQTQQGGLNLQPIYSATIKSWSSDEGVICVEGDPFACLGPDNAHVTIHWCTTCTPDPENFTLAYDCAPGYILNFLDPPECEYPGKQPTAEEIAQWEICPTGYVYDGKEDICVKIVPSSQDCPQGYAYDDTKRCCVAKFTETNPELEGVPPSSYPTCPIGAKSSWPDIMMNEMKCIFEVVFSEIESCHDTVMQVGDCPDPPDKSKCTNPSQYASQGPCEAAGCVWFTDSATGGQRCISP